VSDLVVIEQEEIATFGAVWIEQANALEIKTQDDLESASEYLGEVKRRLKQAEAFTEPVIEKARAAVKAADATRGAALEQRRILQAPYLEAEKIIKDKAGAYHQLVDRLRREGEDAARKQLAQEALDRVEREVQKQQAERQAERDGKPVPIVPPAPKPALTVVPPPAKVKGLGFTTVFEARVVDMMEFVRGVIQGGIPLVLLRVDDAALQKFSNAAKGELKWPGVEVTERVDTSARATKAKRS